MQSKMYPNWTGIIVLIHFVGYDRNAEDADGDDFEAYDSEIGYRNLAEKLKNFENMFSRTSMEGVIYQLAKILFYQSFSMSK